MKIKIQVPFFVSLLSFMSALGMPAAAADLMSAPYVLKAGTFSYSVYPEQVRAFNSARLISDAIPLGVMAKGPAAASTAGDVDSFLKGMIQIAQQDDVALRGELNARVEEVGQSLKKGGVVPPPANPGAPTIALPNTVLAARLDLKEFRSCARQDLPLLKELLALQVRNDQAHVDALANRLADDRFDGSQSGMPSVLCGRYLGKLAFKADTNFMDDVKMLSAFLARDKNQDLELLLEALVASRHPRSPVLNNSFWTLAWQKLSADAVFVSSTTALEDFAALVNKILLDPATFRIAAPSPDLGDLQPEPTAFRSQLEAIVKAGQDFVSQLKTEDSKQ